MPGRLRFLLRYYLFWVASFVLTRLLFLAYHADRASRLRAGTLVGIVGHGLRMDLSAAAYLTVLPALLAMVGSLAATRIARRVVNAYSVAAIVLVALLTTIDLELYSAWGFRLDASPLEFLRTPREALASTESSPIARLAAILAVLIAIGIVAYRRLVARPDAEEERGGIGGAAVSLAACALLVIPIRGGVQWTPLNQSSVYFANDDFANQAALNVGWNVFHSLTTSRALDHTNPYTHIDAATARQVVDSLLASSDPARPLLRVAHPNVILIIWESLTAKVVGRLGGVPGVTPCLDSLSHEGILFDHVYASGDRSAKGLVAILSGYPTQPHVQIMNTPNKAKRLPMLSRDFGAAGYSTAFYYGGELEFANIKSYLIGGRFERIVGEDAFAPKDRNSKWGAHDHVVLGRLLADAGRARRPFFSTLFTLSSHEPFEIPMRPRFPGGDERDAFLSAHAYTDRSVGAFIRAAQRMPWWDSTLVVIIADHGHPLPRITAAGSEAARDHHIPMLWLGGALAVRDTVVERIGSQTDLAPTLLAALGLRHDDYAWGHDLLAPDAASFAYFSYLDGFGFVDARGALVYDALGERVTQRAGDPGEAEVRAGLALLRLSYQDYLDK
ncbi:MAG TPA: sulfatase-like hydrolase/transferase [Gemmatimonadaceae bacterium]|nr:sulfatase-like hydrolase/transferase [Gemmatimonadaceae bacterium]